MNIALAVAAGIAFHIVEYLPNNIGQFFADNLKNALLLNVVLTNPDGDTSEVCCCSDCSIGAIATC